MFERGTQGSQAETGAPPRTSAAIRTFADRAHAGVGRLAQSPRRFQSVATARAADANHRQWCCRRHRDRGPSPRVSEQGIPEIYGSILILGGVDTPYADYRQASTQVGGWMRTPNLGLSYLFAAHRLLRKAGEHRKLAETALPIRYLQRHALELELKEAINTAYAVKADERFLDALGKDSQTPWPERQFANDQTHDLDVLVNELDAALAAIDEGKTPDDVREVAAKITRIEGKKADRWRYLTLKRPKKKPKDEFPEQSFPTPRLMRLGEIQDELEKVFRRNFWIRDEDHLDADDAPFIASMVIRGSAVDQHLYPLLARLGRDGTTSAVDETVEDERDIW